MTVSDLQEELNKYDGNLKVTICSGGSRYSTLEEVLPVDHSMEKKDVGESRSVMQFPKELYILIS